MPSEHKVKAELNKRYRVEIGCSEVCLAMRIAGKIGEIELFQWPESGRYAAQIYMDDKPFSAPVLYSEAGFYQDYDGFYVYELKED